MTAKVLFGGEVYYSPVFAVSWRRGRSDAIILNKDRTGLVCVRIYGSSDYKTVITDFDDTDYAIAETDFKSYWNDRGIFNKVRKGKYSPEMLREAVEMAENVTYDGDFIEINTPMRLRAFETASSYFHDGSVLGIFEKDGCTEILVDSPWGSFLLLRCEDVRENGLKEGDFLFDCETSLDNGEITLSFVSANDDSTPILRAKAISYKPYIRKQIYLNNIKISDDEKAFSICGETISSESDILDFKDRGVIGYLEKDTDARLLIFGKNVGYYCYAPKDYSELKVTIDKLCSMGYSFDEYFTEFDEDDPGDLGEVIYSQRYTRKSQLLQIASYTPILIIYNLFMLLVQALNPDMDWIIYYVFGPGVSAAALIMVLIAVLVDYRRGKKANIKDEKLLEIRENGIRYNGFNGAFSAKYDNVSQVKHRLFITLKAYGERQILHPTRKDKEIYKLICEGIKRANDKH